MKNACECVASLTGIQSEHVLILLLDAFWPLCRTPTLLFSLIITESVQKLQILTVVNIKTIKCATVRHISLKFISCNTSFKAKCSQQVIKISIKGQNLQMFVPQAGKTVFNQSTLILIVRVSFAVWCPRFETQETQNKHAAPGKENTDGFTPLCLSVFLSGFVPRPLLHKHTYK